MPPSRILPQCLHDVLFSLHAATRPVVLKAVDSLSQGGWLTLTEIARHWPGAERVSAPLKAADRLLRSPVLTAGREAIYGAMASWLVREERPLIVVDWSDLKADGSFKLLRAGLAVHGRTLTLWEEVHPQKTAGTVAVESAFLRALAKQLPEGCRPIVLSDAGFRRPWFRAILALGWDYIGRVRGPAVMQSCEGSANEAAEWLPCKALRELAWAAKSREMGMYRLGRRTPLTTRLILHAAPPKGRRALTAKGTRRHDCISEDAARSAKEPWVLVTSLDADEMTAAQVAGCYRRRMTIEQSFRDLKSGLLGAGFEHSQTRKGERLANLLVLFAMVQFAAWLVGLCEEHEHGDARLGVCRQPRRRHHSTMRLGTEVLKRPRWWPPPRILKRFLRSMAHGCPPALTTAAPC